MLTPWWILRQLNVVDRVNYALGIGRYPITPALMLSGEINVPGCRVTPLGCARSVAVHSPCICLYDCQGWRRLDELVALRARRCELLASLGVSEE